MKKNWNITRIIGLLLGIITLVLIILSMCLEEYKFLLYIGLSLNAINLALIGLTQRKDK